MKHNLRNMGFTKKADESWRDASMRCLRNNGLTGMVPKSIQDAESVEVTGGI
jgi:hypothetical protein